jgi:capsular exopolysaccharide synthesis family protein
MEKMPDTQNVEIFVGPYSYQYDPKLRLANLAQMIMSREVLEDAARTLSELGKSAYPEKILRTIRVQPLMDTTLLVIMVQSDSEEEAVATADVVRKCFIDFYNRMNSRGAARTREFIESELPKAEARLRKIREELRKYKESTGAVALQRQTDALIQQLTQAQVNLAQYQIMAQQAEARLRELESKLDAYPESRISATVFSSNPVWQALATDLARQHIELQRMLQTRTEDHPQVQALKRAIAETEENMKKAGETILNNTTQTTNPIVDELQRSYLNSLAEFAAADAARKAAQQVVDSLQPKLETLPEQEEKLARLTLDEKTAEDTYTLLSQKLQEAKLKEKQAENMSSIQVIEEAQVREADPKKRLKILLALFLSPIFCSGIALLLNYLDNTVRTPADAEALLKLPVYAVVPIAKAHSLADGEQAPVIGTSYQMLSANLLVGQPKLDGHSLLIASAEPDVGRSTTAANLAITLARDGARVILVDSDFRQPSQHKIFGVGNEKGLSNVLAGQLALPDALHPTSVRDLLLLPSGPIPSNPVRLLRSPEMIKFVQTINDLADFIVFDSPAGITFADTTLLAALIKNVIIVHAAGTVPRGAEQEFRVRLEHAGANMLGVVLNMVRPEDSHGYYHFRSAYEELMKGSKVPAALMGSSTNSSSHTDSEKPNNNTNV